MSIGNISNCPNCGKIFVKGIHDICPACVKDLQVQYEKCVKYLHENRQATLQELSEGTEVSVRQITRFIKEGRISIAKNPNMSYTCEVCEKSIREGTICDECRSRLVKDLSHATTAKQSEQEKANPQLGFKIKDRLDDRH